MDIYRFMPDSHYLPWQRDTVKGFETNVKSMVHTYKAANWPNVQYVETGLICQLSNLESNSVTGQQTTGRQ